MKSCSIFSRKAWAFFFAALLLLTLGLGCSGSEARNQKRGEPKDRTLIVRSAAFSPDGKLFVIATGPQPGSRAANVPQQRAMQLWDVESGKLLHTFSLEEPATDIFFFDRDKKILVSVGGNIKIFDVASHTLDGKYLSPAWLLAMMPDGKKLLVLTNNEGKNWAVEIWDAFTGKSLQKFPTHVSKPRSLAVISPDGKWALVPRHSGLQLWDLSKGEVRHSFGLDSKVQEPIAFSPDGKSWVAQRLEEMRLDGNHKYSLVLLEIVTGKVVRVIEGPLRGRQIVAYSKNGKQLVIVDEPLSQSFRRLEVETGKQLSSISLGVNRENEPDMGCFLSPDSTKLLKVSGRGRRTFDLETLRLEIWDVVQGKKLRELNRKEP